MTTSETTLSNALNSLEVESNSNSPGFQTPQMSNSISDETVSLLKEAALKLKKPKASTSKRQLDTVSIKKTGTSKKRKLEDKGDPKIPITREGFPNTSKPIYLRAKQLYIKKLHLASSVQAIKSQLADGKFPVLIGYKCPTPSRDNQDFSIKWSTTVCQHKKALTEMWTEELSRKYVLCKNDIKQCLLELQVILTNDQYQELKKTLDDRYKEAASKQMSKKLKTPQKDSQKDSAKKSGNRLPNRRQNPNQQIKQILAGLNKLIQDKN